MKIEIYVHIPFCVKKCAYCDFLSGESTEAEREQYVQLLCEEIEECVGKTDGYEVSSVFFGGGTPSILTGEQVERILETIRRVFVVCDESEITLEMNPGTATLEKLRWFRKAGVNRLSIGLQSVHDKELEKLGRIHTYEEFKQSYLWAREAGFINVNVDLISAIPGQSKESWREGLKTVLELRPEHISAYSLIVEPGTPFYELYGEQGAAKSEMPHEDEERQIYWQTKEVLREAGYERYEVSNYALPGFACRHNEGYWRRVPYLGFGIGAASLVPENMMNHKNVGNHREGKRTSRYTNPDNITEYKNSFSEKFAGDLLSREEEVEEFMFLGLREMSGISKSVFRSCFGVELKKFYKRQLEKLVQLELLEEDAEYVRLTDKGIDVSNAVFVEFIV